MWHVYRLDIERDTTKIDVDCVFVDSSKQRGNLSSLSDINWRRIDALRDRAEYIKASFWLVRSWR